MLEFLQTNSTLLSIALLLFPLSLTAAISFEEVATCRTNPRCGNFSGECCPTIKGQWLDCCEKHEKVTFDDLIERMKADALELAKHVEILYRRNRCNATSLEQCYKQNYHDCVSKFPNQQCLTGEDLTLADCGICVNCSALWDYTVSTVRIPKDLATSDWNPKDQSLVETVCFTRELDEWFVSKYGQDRSFWAYNEVRSPQMYFGSTNGAFRIYPARQTKDCGEYDPRERPWYIAGSSGPKNVILVLDTSHSMKGEQLRLMQEAAKQVIRSLTVGDQVAVVRFASDGALYGHQNKYLYQANKKSKETLFQAIDGFNASGGKELDDLLDAFNQTFTVLENSIQKGYHRWSNTAILFFTDEGEMSTSQGVNKSMVIDYISSNLAKLETRLNNRPIFLFAYSISLNGDVDGRAFPKQMACSTTKTGVWVVVKASDVRKSLTSYFLLFALGLGTGKNENFTAWVEPYEFATGGIEGTTVSAPVYDRSKTPPLFLGVVGIDFPLVTVEKALGVEEGSRESIDRIIAASEARKANITLTPCELEAFRGLGSSRDDALCNADNCNGDNLVIIQEDICPVVSVEDLWKDRTYDGWPYPNRTCCLVGQDRPSDECPAGNLSSTKEPTAAPTDEKSRGDKAAIIGGVVGGIAGVFLLVACLYCIKPRPMPGPENPDSTAAKPSGIEVTVPPVPTTESAPGLPSAAAPSGNSEHAGSPIMISKSVVPMPPPPMPSAPCDPESVPRP